jgi:hypothetical protein
MLTGLALGQTAGSVLCIVVLWRAARIVEGLAEVGKQLLDAPGDAPVSLDLAVPAAGGGVSSVPLRSSSAAGPAIVTPGPRTAL